MSGVTALTAGNFCVGERWQCEGPLGSFLSRFPYRLDDSTAGALEVGGEGGEALAEECFECQHERSDEL